MDRLATLAAGPASDAAAAAGPPPLNASKLALLIEDRPQAVLAPLALHFMAVLPPAWPFLFLGSPASLARLNASAAARSRVRTGKLTLAAIPANASTRGQERVSRFLTSRWLYEVAVAPAAWLLVFQTDSVLCANSRRDADALVGYDWVGAPWQPGDGGWGGNGGLSLRGVARIVDVLRNQQRRDGSEPEDVWLAERLAHVPGARLANGSVARAFSGETYSGDAAGAAAGLVAGLDDWRRAFYEPMGYHTGGSGAWLQSPIWGTPELRAHIYRYCPEIKMTLAMDVAAYVPGHCAAYW